MANHGHKIFCLVGPSGSGKDSLKKELLLPYIVSYRTRTIRAGEVEGKDGYWITRDEFLERKSNGDWIAETDYAGNYYGIDQGELIPLEDSPMTYVIDIDGVDVLRDTLNKMEGYSSDQVVTIYIKSSKIDLERRMIRQGRTGKEIQTRLIQYDYDIEAENSCNYIVENENGKMDRALRKIYEIILLEEGVIINEKDNIVF